MDVQEAWALRELGPMPPARASAVALSACCAGFGVLELITAAELIAVGLVGFGLLGFAVATKPPLIGPYFVVCGAIYLQLALAAESIGPALHAPSPLFRASGVYAVAGLACVLAGIAACRLSRSRFRDTVFGADDLPEGYN